MPLTQDFITPALSKALDAALTNGRVTFQTASKHAICKLVTAKMLKQDELAGVFVLTEYGQCVAGEPPF